MKIFYQTMSCILFLIVFSSCDSYSGYDKMIVGHWNAIQWETENNVRNADVSRYSFDFDNEGNYQSKFGGVDEEGTYRIEYNRLYTKNGGDDEIVVEIQSMTSDTLRIGMNRGGVQETLVLVK